MHITSWLLAIILFFITWNLLKNGKNQAAKIIHMINRVLFLGVLFTGGMLLYRYTQAPVWEDFAIEAIVKGLAGIWLICIMEWFYTRFKKGLPSKGLIVQFFFILAIVLILGFGRLPWGLLP